MIDSRPLGGCSECGSLFCLSKRSQIKRRTEGLIYRFARLACSWSKICLFSLFGIFSPVDVEFHTAFVLHDDIVEIQTAHTRACTNPAIFAWRDVRMGFVHRR